MITQHLKKLYYLSVPLFTLHTMEEFVTIYGFTLKNSAGFFSANLPKGYEAALPTPIHFLQIELLVWLALSIFAFLLIRKQLPFVFLILPGLLYLYQFEHLSNTFAMHRYYSGLVTGTLLFVLGLFYWGELVRILFTKRIGDTGKRKRKDKKKMV